MSKNHFVVIFFVMGLIFLTETLAKNEEPDISHDSDQLQEEGNIANRIHRLEDTLQKYSDENKSVIQRVEDKLQKYSNEYKSVNTDFNKHANTIGWVMGAIATTIAAITVIITIITFVATLAVPRYYKITNALKQAEAKSINALKQAEAKSKIQQQLDILMARIELGVVQQELESSSKITEDDDSDSADSAKSVVAAYSIGLQIRSTLEEIRSGGKDVDIPVLCDRLQELSDRDTEDKEDSWARNLRDYLVLLLSSEFLDDDIAKQAVKNLLRNL